MKITSKAGFAAVETLLMLIILVIVAGTGCFVWHARQATNQSLDEAAKTSKQTANVAKKPDTTQQEIKDSNVSSAFVKKTYVAYVTSLNKNHNVSQAIYENKDAFSDALRVNLTGRSSSYDPVLCTTETIDPNKISVVSVIPSATVIGNNVDQTGKNQFLVQVNYDIKSHKIVDISCQ